MQDIQHPTPHTLQFDPWSLICPVCGAKPGEQCTFENGFSDRITTHMGRAPR